MEKEDLKKKEEDNNYPSKETNISTEEDKSKNNGKDLDDKEQVKEILPEEEIKNLKDKLARTFAEMENQRRRFEKEKDDALSTEVFLLLKSH